MLEDVTRWPLCIAMLFYVVLDYHTVDSCRSSWVRLSYVHCHPKTYLSESQTISCKTVVLAGIDTEGLTLICLGGCVSPNMYIS